MLILGRSSILARDTSEISPITDVGNKRMQGLEIDLAIRG
jgi:hypothetical protein